jgi:epoxyqueuosine reductase
MARNAAIALGNSGDARAEPILLELLGGHDEPLARGHAASALRNLLGDAARRPLIDALAVETDPYVRDEIVTAAEGVPFGLESGQDAHIEML